MKKIPVKIVQYTMNGQIRKNVMLDIFDTYEIEGDVEKKVSDFKKQYFEIVNDAEKLFYGKKIDEKKKYQNLSSSVYWKLCILLNNFNKQIENEFEITNYIEAISRDFGLSKDYIYDMLTIVKIFNKNEIIDSVPFSYYRALKRKYSELKQLSLFENEKKRLNKMGKENKLPGRENYKEELIKIIKKHSKKK